MLLVAGPDSNSNGIVEHELNTLKDTPSPVGRSIQVTL